MNGSAQSARAIASLAYVFVFPLVANYARMYGELFDPEAENVATSGVWRPTASGSSIWLDLRTDAWLVTQSAPSPGGPPEPLWTDLWGFGLLDRAIAGGDDEKPQALIAGHEWSGPVPPDVRLIRSESAFVNGSTTGPTAMSDGSTGVESLSTRLGLPARPPLPLRWRACGAGFETGDEFWSCANFALTLATPHPDDAPVLERMAEIGVGPGRAWDPTELGADVREAIQAGMEDALTALMRAARTMRAESLPITRGEMDRDYSRRALVVLGREGFRAR